MEICSVPYRLLRQRAAQNTTAIARMLGKAVKLRHCPATVSAPAQRPVLSGRAGNQPGSFRLSRRSLVNHCTASSLERACGKVAGKAQVRRPVLAPSTHLRSEGNEGAIMPVHTPSFFSGLLPRELPRAFALLLLAACATYCPAASIRGVVTDASGAKVTGANVVLLSGGKAVGAAVSKADGSFQIITGVEGRFFLLVSAKSFRQLETPGFLRRPARFDRAQRRA